VAKLTDHAVLAELATEDAYWLIRRAAVVKLTDQAVLAKVAEEDEDPSVRSAAARKLAELTNEAVPPR
jgi:hypothetical protein